MANHLIIGLGGTGGKIIREFRKRIFEEYRSNTPSNGLSLEYLYLDSSDTDINSKDGWSVLGNDISLGQAQKVNIHGINQQMFDNINAYPGMAAFLTPQDISLMQQNIGPLITAGVGGQRRRLGRVLLANNLANQNVATNFGSMLRSAVNRLQQDSGKQNVTFHICAGLAGGTGSGSIVDVISLIRTMYPWDQNTKNFKMRLMLYIPEANLVSSSFNAGFYQANGYAALLELNALSVGAYNPVDITGTKDPITQQVQRLLANQDSFEAAYVYTHVNERGRMLDLNTELPQAVADFLFQSITLTMTNNQQLSRMVGCENNGAAPEKNQAGAPARSRRFMTFGITRVEYPEHEITEYVTYKFAQQAAYQLVYNYWVAGQGYAQRPDNQIGAGFENEILSNENQESLMLSDAYLKLEKPIVSHPGTDKWRDITKTWHDLTVSHQTNILATIERSKWVDELDTRCSNYYNTLFRGNNVGVDNFYNTSVNSIPAYAQSIRNRVEQVLFNEWAAGTGKSIQEIDKYISLLIQSCEKRCTNYKTKVGDLTSRLQKNHETIQAVRARWDEIFLGKLFHQSERVSEKFRAALEVDYIDRTNIEAYSFAEKLMNNVIVQLNDLQCKVRDFQDRLTDIANKVLEQSNTTLVQGNTTTLIRKYDDGMMRGFVNERVHDERLQSSIAVRIRTALIRRLEDGAQTFSNILKITDDETSAIILAECNSAAIDAMGQAALNNPANQMVGVNILNKLQDELSSDMAIANFVDDVVKTASVYTQWNQAEMANVLAGGGNSMMRMVQLIIPEGTDSNNEFRNRLIAKFQENVPGFNPAVDVSENQKSNQLVVITCNSGFPVRFVSNLSTLRREYEKLINDPNSVANNKMVLHTESFTTPLPSLYEFTPMEIKKMVERPLLLAFAMHLLEEHADPQTGAKNYCLMQNDAMLGILVPTSLGSNIALILDNLGQNYALADKLVQTVADALRVKAQHNDQKKVIASALGQLLEGQIKTYLCNGNNMSPEYNYYLNVIRDIVNHELKQL